MAKVLVVTSGKGGVGKTTSTAALGAALAQMGKNVVVVDFDVGLRNLDLVMGAERRVVYDLINVVQGDAKLSQALIRDKRVETLYLLPASQTRDKDALTSEGVERVMGEMRERFDWVICDSPAGIERGATLAMRHADVAVVVTNPEVSSVRDSDRIIGLLDSKTAEAEKGERIDKHLLLTRYDPARAERGEMLKTEDVLEILSIPLLGIIPESQEVLRASNVGSPITIANPLAAAARAYTDAARRLCRRNRGPHHSDRQEEPVRQAVHAEGRMNLICPTSSICSGSSRRAPIARDRLQILLSHERTIAGGSDLVAILREEILAVIKKHVNVDSEKVQVKMDRGESVSMLEVDIEIPTPTKRMTVPMPKAEAKAAAKTEAKAAAKAA